MKKITLFVLCLALISTNAFAIKFSPTLLKLSVAPTVQYNFDGSELQIPVTVTGTNALLWFFVFTKDQAKNIGPVQNGFMGWHYVNKIDTCIYMSPSNNFSRGSNLVRWNGKDNDGNLIPAGDYTYYMWAFDGIGPKTRMTMFFSGYYHTVDFQELDENGNPLNNPIYYNTSQRWTVGNDPMDSTLIETCNIALPSGWGKGDNLWIYPKDFDIVYQGVKNKDSKVAGITKWNWIPNGDAVFITAFGDNGYSLFNSACDAHSPVIVSDLNYIYTVDQAYHNTDGNSDFYIFDFDGVKIAELDMTEWWNHPDDLTGGGQINGGPNDHNIRNGKVVLNCHCSCTKQMVDPIAWLESGNDDASIYGPTGTAITFSTTTTCQLMPSPGFVTTTIPGRTRPI